MIEPEVSVPIVKALNAAAPAEPLPLDEPDGFWSASTASSTWPVRLLKPDGWLPKKFAYSDRPSLPRITTPFSRSFLATPESIAGYELRSDQLPADVYMPFTSIRSLSRIGSPCAGPRTWPSRRSLSSSAASCNACEFSCVTAFRPGPRLFRAAMRAMYARVSSTEVSLPSSIIFSAVGPSSVSRLSSAACAGAAHSAQPMTAAANARFKRCSLHPWLQRLPTQQADGGDAIRAPAHLSLDRRSNSLRTGGRQRVRQRLGIRAGAHRLRGADRLRERHRDHVVGDRGAVRLEHPQATQRRGQRERAI